MEEAEKDIFLAAIPQIMTAIRGLAHEQPYTSIYSSLETITQKVTQNENNLPPEEIDNELRPVCTQLHKALTEDLDHLSKEIDDKDVVESDKPELIATAHAVGSIIHSIQSTMDQLGYEYERLA